MTFTRIIGHERQKEILGRALQTGRLAHAYLFEGAEGIGKRLMAMALARAVLCRERTGCGDCPACRKVDHQNHPDLHLLAPEGTTIKIEQVRELQRELAFRPLEGARRICLIDGADRLNAASGNALLKTLEEPPGGTLMILLATEGDNVLSTIRSRCQRLPFARLPRERLRETLQERLGLDEGGSHVLATLSDGSFSKALGKDRDLFLEKRRGLLQQVTALSAGSIVPLFESAKELAEDKERLNDVLEIFQGFYRDVLLHLNGCPEDDLINIDLMQKIRRTAARETPASLLRKLEALAAARRHLDRNVNRELALDLLLLRLAA